MARLVPSLFGVIVLAAICSRPIASAQSITLPPGTRIELVVTRPLPVKTTKAGDALYAQTSFPVSLGNQLAIPAGTYLESRIVSVTPVNRKTVHALVEIASTKLIFANGYTLLLPPDNAPGAMVTDITLQVRSNNDLLLDNGGQFEVTLASALALDTTQVKAAAALSHAPEPGQFKSATQCRTTPGYPGSPGSPDTVIPGSPGTPSITIPGANGAPDTTIPGTPATPDTVIPGMPGTPGSPGTICPGPPLVISSLPAPSKSQTHTP
jgi:hypothetical protein